MSNTHNHFPLKRARRRMARCVVAAAAFATFNSIASRAEAADIIWTGGGGGGGSAWFTGTNWTGGVTPGSSDIAEFAGAGISTFVGINMNFLGGIAPAGEIVLSGTTSVRNIGNSSTTTSGSLMLYGVGGTLIANTSSATPLTFWNSVGGGNKVMQINLVNSGNIEVTNVGAAININTNIIGTGGFTKTGAGILSLNAANTYSGSTQIAGGVVVANTGSAFGSGGGPVTISPTGSTTASLLLGSNVNLARSISVNSGSGAVTLGASTGSATFSGLVDLGRDLTISANTNSTLSLAGAISDSIQSSSVNVNGATVVMAAQNSYTGATTINSGTLKLGVSNALPGTVLNFAGASTTFDLAGFNQTVKSLSSVSSNGLVTNSSGSASTLTLSSTDPGLGTTYTGSIGGNISLVVNNPQNAVQEFDGVCSYTGSTTILAGSLYTNGQNLLPSTTAVSIAAGGALNLGGFNQNIGALSGAGGVVLSSGALTVNQASDTTFSGNFVFGPGTVTKTGTGTLTINGTQASTNTGLTSVNGGTLELGKTSGINATLNGDVTVNSGGTLKWLSDEQIPDSATLTLNSGGTVNLNGHIETVGSFVDNGGTTLLGGGGIYISSGDLNLTDGSVIATNVGLAGNVNYTGTTTPATISGNITLSAGPSAHTFSVSDATSATDLLVSGNISATTSGLTKMGAGTLQLTGTNNLDQGLVDVEQGRVQIAGGSLTSSSYIFAGDDYNGVVVDQTGGSVSLFGLQVGRGAASTGVYNISGSSTLTTSGELTVGGFGGGTLNQSGGTVNANYLRVAAGSGAGLYNLTGGALNVTTNAWVAQSNTSTGTIVQSGGIATIGTSLYVGNDADCRGNYNLSGGSLTVSGDEYVGNSGIGTFTQTGGTHAVTGALYVGYASGGTGSYNLGGGTLNLSSGALVLGSSGSGSLNITSGQLDASGGNDIIVGLNGSGAVTQSGGSVTTPNVLRFGVNSGSSGTYNLSNGSVTIGGALIADAGSATFTQTGGTLSTGSGSLVMGNQSGASALYSLSGSAVLNAGLTTIAESGTATFVQTGGVANFSSGLTIGHSNGSSGFYIQSGGTAAVTGAVFMGLGFGAAGSYTLSDSGVLTTAQLNVGYTGFGTFVQTGGVITTDSVGVAQSGGGGVYNLSGGMLNGGEDAVGAGFGAYGGTLNQSGGVYNSGTLTIAHSGNAGVYNLSAGTLTVATTETAGLTGPGTFVQTGGVHSVTSNLYLGTVGGTANYSISAGSLSAANIYLDGTNVSSGNGATLAISGSAAVSTPGQLKIWNVANTQLNLSGGSLTVGSIDTQGNGSLFNWTGGTLTYQSQLTIESGGSLGGTLNVGAGQVLNTGDFLIASNAAGALNVSGGGVVNTNSTGLGIVQLGGNANATATVDGAGSAWNIFGTEFRIGNSGNASLSLTNAASVAMTGDVSIARTAGTSVLSVDSSTFAATGSVYVGGSSSATGGAASFIINNSSVVIGDTLHVWGTGGGTSLTISGASNVSANALVLDGGINSVGVGSTLTVGSGGISLSQDYPVTLTLAQGTGNSGTLVLNGDLTSSGTVGTAVITSGFGPPLSQRGTVDLGDGTRTFNVADGPNSTDLSITTRITNGSIIKTGSGVLALSYPNDYSGSTTINAGGIIIQSDNALPTTTDLMVASGASFDLNSQNQTLGSLAGAGTVLLGTSTATTLTVGGSDSSTTFSGPISGSGTLIKEGAGTMVTSGALSFSNGLTVSGGVLQLSPGNSFGSAGSQVISLVGNGPVFGTLAVGDDTAMGATSNSISFTGGHFQAISTFASNRSFTLGAGNGTIDVLSGQTFSIQGALGGTDGLNKIGAGTLKLAVVSTYAGNTNLLEGTILCNVGGTNRIPTGGVFQMAAGTTLDLNGNNQTLATLLGDGTIALGGGTFTTGSGDSSTAFAGSIIGGGSVVKNGNGTFYLTGSNSFSSGATVSAGELSLLGSNSFGGGINIQSGGTLSANSDAALGNAFNNISLAGKLSALDTFQTSHPITISGTAPTFDVSTGNTLTVAADISGTISIAGALHKTSPGMLRVVLPVSMAPSVMDLDGGTFDLYDNGAATGVSGAFAILTGATLDLDNTLTNNSNRLSDSVGINLNGGTFRMGGNASQSSGESTGMIIQLPGESTIALTEGAGGTTAVTFAGLSGGLNPSATLNFQANALGSTNKLIITGRSAGFMGARYTINGVDYADYDATNGVQVVSSYTSSFAPAAHVLLNADVSTGSASVSTLSLDASNNPVNLTLTGGLSLDGILKFGSNTASITGSTISNNTGNYLYVTTGGGDLTIDSALKDGASSLALVKSGAGTLILTSTDATHHNFSGGIYLNNGTLQVASDANLGASANNGNDIHFYGGTLAVSTGFSLNANRQLLFNPNGGGINVAGTETLTAATSNQLAGSGSNPWFNKTGAGTFVISNSNQNFSGPVNVQQGTLELQNTGALGGTGSSWSTITLNPSASLTLRSDGPYPADFHSNIVVTDQQTSDPIATINTERFTAGTGGAYQLGSLTIGNATLVNSGSTGRLQFKNTVTLNGNATFSNSRDLILTGQVTGTGTLTKTGPANMVLGADPNDLSASPDTKNNTYIGLTTISQGALYLNKQPGVNAITGNINMDGGQLILLAPRQIADTSTLTLSGGLVDVNGKSDTVNNISATGTAQVKVAGGGSLVVKNTTISGSAVLTISSPAQESGPSSGKFGVGTSVETIDSGTYYTDSLDVSDGSIIVNPGGVLSIGPHGLSFSGTNNPLITLVANSTTPGETLLGGNVAFTGTSGTAKFFNTNTPPIAGTVDLGGFTRTFSVTSSTATLTLDGARMVNGGIRKEGSGTLRLSTDSTYPLGTAIAGGAVEVTSAGALGTGPLTLSNSPTVRLLSDSAVTTFPNDLTTGSATIFIGPNNGATTNTFQFNRLNIGEVELDVLGASTGKLEFLGDSALNGNATFTSNPTLQFSGSISGAFGITKSSGAGALVLAGTKANTFSGVAKVQAGVLELNKSNNINAVGGDITAQNGTVRWDHDEQVPNTSTLTTLTRTSILDLNNHSETVTNLNMTSGTLQSGTGTLTMLGNLTASASTFVGTVSGNVALSQLTGASHTFAVNNAVSPTTLSIPAALSGAGNINKTGAGTLILSGNNSTYKGMVTVSAGTLGVGSAGALGTADLVLNGGSLNSVGAINTSRSVSLVASATIDTGNFATTFGSLAGAGTLTKAGSATLGASSISLGGLNVGSGTVRMMPRTGAAAGVMRLNTLNVGSESALDLNDNDLVVNNGDFATIQGLVFTGYRQGADPSATGIISSTGQAAVGNPILALVNNALIGSNDYPFGSGKTVAAAAIIGKYTYFGDTNLDGQVTADDYGALDANFGATGVDPGIAWIIGDTNFDSSITSDDYGTLDANFGLGTSAGQPLASQGMTDVLIHANSTELALPVSTFTAVPEPAAPGLVILAAGMLARRRRRSSRRSNRAGSISPFQAAAQ